ncbi:MAG TPA: hypothetical protein VFQ60_04195 [Patescibacteria group bacterium]|nr:hypothetical protein [Patescibacteria group bacterium]
MQRRFFFIAAVLLLLMQADVVFAMSSPSFMINWDSINTGGDELSSSTNYSVQDTVGDFSGSSTSANYQISSGYRAAQGADSLSFIIEGQDKATQTAYTALSLADKTVTVESAVPFSVGNYIAVIENNGFSERVLVGKITSINGLVLTVDKFDGATDTIGATPSGGDDFVYVLGTSLASFGTVSANSANTSVVMSSVNSSVPSGYTVYVQADQALQNASAQAIAAPVGTITVGTEAYGASVTGTRAYLPDSDASVNASARAIQTNSGPSVAGPDRVSMTYKLSVVSATNSGTYSQNVYYILTANY